MSEPQVSAPPEKGPAVALDGVAPLSFVIGPASAAKAAFAEHLSQALPNALRLEAGRGRTGEAALEALIGHLRTPLSDHLIVECPEESLTPAQQRRFMAVARAQARWGLRPLFLVTGSAHICDLKRIDNLCAVISFGEGEAAAWLAA